MGLSICDRMSYAGKICQETVGSFSETNPPGACFGGGATCFCREIGVFLGEMRGPGRVRSNENRTDAVSGDAAYNGESAVADRRYRRNAGQCGRL